MIFGGYACMEAFVVRHSRPVFSHERTKDESQAKVELKRYEEACRTVGIDEYIRSLPDGYQTVIGSGGGMSVGQRQQIAIARAIVKDAPMVILDEATSSVDTRTEKRIQQAMDMMTGGRTSFVIAHRLSTVRNANRILVMVGGEIVESGTHEELLELGGYYRALHDAQFEERDRGRPRRSAQIPPMSISH